MKTRIYRVVTIPALPIGNYRSFPAEVGNAAPSRPVGPPRFMVHPQEMSQTVEAGFRPLEPRSGSTLATECPPAQLAAEAAEVE